MAEQMSEQLERIEKLLAENKRTQKDVLNLKEACEYIGLSTSCMYKLTSQRRIPFSRPGGKRIYFRRADLDQWMLSQRYAADYEVEREADKYIVNRLKQKSNG